VGCILHVLVCVYMWKGLFYSIMTLQCVAHTLTLTTSHSHSLAHSHTRTHTYKHTRREGRYTGSANPISAPDSRDWGEVILCCSCTGRDVTILFYPAPDSRDSRNLYFFSLHLTRAIGERLCCVVPAPDSRYSREDTNYFFPAPGKKSA